MARININIVIRISGRAVGWVAIKYGSGTIHVINGLVLSCVAYACSYRDFW